jgi:hypothetical protein
MIGHAPNALVVCAGGVANAVRGRIVAFAGLIGCA